MSCENAVQEAQTHNIGMYAAPPKFVALVLINARLVDALIQTRATKEQFT